MTTNATPLEAFRAWQSANDTALRAAVARINAAPRYSITPNGLPFGDRSDIADELSIARMLATRDTLRSVIGLLEAT